MNLNRKIHIVAHSAIIEYVALLQWNSAVAPLRQHDDFDLLHDFWAWRHCSIYKLVRKSMNPNRGIRIVIHSAIIERVVLLSSGILPL